MRGRLRGSPHRNGRLKLLLGCAALVRTPPPPDLPGQDHSRSSKATHPAAQLIPVARSGPPSGPPVTQEPGVVQRRRAQGREQGSLLRGLGLGDRQLVTPGRELEHTRAGGGSGGSWTHAPGASRGPRPAVLEAPGSPHCRPPGVCSAPRFAGGGCPGAGSAYAAGLTSRPSQPPARPRPLHRCHRAAPAPPTSGALPEPTIPPHPRFPLPRHTTPALPGASSAQTRAAPAPARSVGLLCADAGNARSGVSFAQTRRVLGPPGLARVEAGRGRGAGLVLVRVVPGAGLAGGVAAAGACNPRGRFYVFVPSSLTPSPTPAGLCGGSRRFAEPFPSRRPPRPVQVRGDGWRGARVAPAARARATLARSLRSPRPRRWPRTRSSSGPGARRGCSADPRPRPLAPSRRHELLPQIRSQSPRSSTPRAPAGGGEPRCGRDPGPLGPACADGGRFTAERPRRRSRELLIRPWVLAGLLLRGNTGNANMFSRFLRCF